MESPLHRVLIVDSNHLVADTLSLIFEKSGFDTHTTYSVEQALASAWNFHPDLLVCDISIPDHEESLGADHQGVSLVHAITQEFPSCCILVLTDCYANLHGIQECMDRLAQPVGVFAKPCPPADLLRKASAMLALSQVHV
jgi:CheY-like chemotaxis protein